MGNKASQQVSKGYSNKGIFFRVLYGIMAKTSMGSKYYLPNPLQWGLKFRTRSEFWLYIVVQLVNSSEFDPPFKLWFSKCLVFKWGLKSEQQQHYQGIFAPFSALKIWMLSGKFRRSRNLKSMCPWLSRSSIMKTKNCAKSKHEYKPSSNSSEKLSLNQLRLEYYI